jgi:hypothetical protein
MAALFDVGRGLELLSRQHEEEFAGKRGRANVDSKRAELDALFGGAEAPKKPNPLDDLFKE